MVQYLCKPFVNHKATKEMSRILAQINFRKNPYRGVLSAVANQKGITRQAVWKGVQRGAPRMIAAVKSELLRINTIIQ